MVIYPEIWAVRKPVFPLASGGIGRKEQVVLGVVRSSGFGEKKLGNSTNLFLDFGVEMDSSSCSCTFDEMHGWPSFVNCASDSIQICDTVLFSLASN